MRHQADRMKLSSRCAHGQGKVTALRSPYTTDTMHVGPQYDETDFWTMMYSIHVHRKTGPHRPNRGDAMFDAKLAGDSGNINLVPAGSSFWPLVRKSLLEPCVDVIEHLWRNIVS
jgi:hypothetical protein